MGTSILKISSTKLQ